METQLIILPIHSKSTRLPLCGTTSVGSGFWPYVACWELDEMILHEGLNEISVFGKHQPRTPLPPNAASVNAGNRRLTIEWNVTIDASNYYYYDLEDLGYQETLNFLLTQEKLLGVSWEYKLFRGGDNEWKHVGKEETTFWAGITPMPI